MPEMDDDKGTSVVLLHSEKGKKLFDKLRNEVVSCAAETDIVLSPTADSRKSVTAHPNRAKFFARLEEGANISELLKLLKPSFMSRVKRKIRFLIRKLFESK
jgi:hypothetical protein